MSTLPSIYKSFGAVAEHIRARTAPIKIANKSKRFVVLMTALALTPVQATAAAGTRLTQSGVVTYVVDGDTVWVQIGVYDQPLKVRLQGIDAPEICQAGGLQAQAALKSRVLGHRVTVTSSAHDDYGRALGMVHLQGEDVGRWLVASGHAWVYSYQKRKAAYTQEFAQAKAARRGLFSDSQAQEPRDFRKAHGGCYVSKKRPPSYKKSGGF